MLEKSKAPIYLAILAMMVVTLWSVAWVRARESRSYHESLAPLVKIDAARIRDADDAKDLAASVAAPTDDVATAHP